MRLFIITIMLSITCLVQAQVNTDELGEIKVSSKEIEKFKVSSVKNYSFVSMQHIQYMVDTFTIDLNLQRYLDEGAGSSMALGWAITEYDKLLNRVYQQLLHSLKTSTEKTFLIDAQKTWLSFKEKEIKFWNERNKKELKDGGSLIRQAAIFNQLKMIKQRVMELEIHREFGTEM